MVFGGRLPGRTGSVESVCQVGKSSADDDLILVEGGREQNAILVLGRSR